MNISANISNSIKAYRKEQSLSQEALAEKLGVTSQAVSKWECMQSIPDIEALVELCTLMEISLDKLVLGKDAEAVQEKITVEKESEEESLDGEAIESEAGDIDDGKGQHFDRRGLFNKYYFDALPNDDELRVVQFKGRLMLSERTYNKNAIIKLALDPAFAKKRTINVRVIGSAHVDGDISGNVQAGDSLHCGNISGGVKAGDSIQCGNVSGGVHAGDGVNCGNVVGNVIAGDGVNCGSVSGNVTAGDNVRCGDVNVIHRCGGDIHCKSIKGAVTHCSGGLHVENK